MGMGNALTVARYVFHLAIGTAGAMLLAVALALLFSCGLGALRLGAQVSLIQRLGAMPTFPLQWGIAAYLDSC